MKKKRNNKPCNRILEMAVEFFLRFMEILGFVMTMFGVCCIDSTPVWPFALMAVVGMIIALGATLVLDA